MANNPYVNKVQYGNTVLIDLTGDTATAADVVSGKTFHDRSGEQKTGSFNPTLQAKTVNPTTSQQVVTPDSGYHGLSQVTVNSILIPVNPEASYKQQIGAIWIES